MKHEILLLPEVAERLRVSTATVNRLLALRRKGIGDFPLPLSPFRGKCRWLQGDVDNYIAKLSEVNKDITVPIKSKKQNKKAFDMRQEEAARALDRHRK